MSDCRIPKVPSVHVPCDKECQDIKKNEDLKNRLSGTPSGAASTKSTTSSKSDRLARSMAKDTHDWNKCETMANWFNTPSSTVSMSSGASYAPSTTSLIRSIPCTNSSKQDLVASPMDYEVHGWNESSEAIANWFHTSSTTSSLTPLRTSTKSPSSSKKPDSVGSPQAKEERHQWNKSSDAIINWFHRPSTSAPTPSKTPDTTSSGSTKHEPLPSPMVDLLLKAWDSHEWNRSSKATTDWLNARWEKTGYTVTEEVVYFTLRLHGRDVVMGMRDPQDGAFYRD